MAHWRSEGPCDQTNYVRWIQIPNKITIPPWPGGLTTYPKLVLVIISVIKSDDVSVTQFMKDVDLHGKIREFLVRFNTTNFGSCISVIFSVPCFVDFSEGSISKFPYYLPECQWIYSFLDVRKTLPLLAVTVSNVKGLLDAAQERHGVVVSLRPSLDSHFTPWGRWWRVYCFLVAWLTGRTGLLQLLVTVGAAWSLLSLLGIKISPGQVVLGVTFWKWTVKWGPGECVRCEVCACPQWLTEWLAGTGGTESGVSTAVGPGIQGPTNTAATIYLPHTQRGQLLKCLHS